MIAKEVKRQRTDAGHTQGQLSDLADIGRATLSKIERGIVAIDMEQIDRLAHAFKMEPEEFIASARRHARERQDRDYRPDGTLDPEVVRGAASSKERLAEMSAQRKERSAGKRVSTSAT